jgi:formylglycine-generating enzyme required for sulfatase activity
LTIGLLALGWSATSLAEDRKEREFQECPECPVMVGIPAGTLMGAAPRRTFRSEGPQHEVAIKAFALENMTSPANNFSPSSRRPVTSLAPAAPSSA